MAGARCLPDTVHRSISEYTGPYSEAIMDSDAITKKQAAKLLNLKRTTLIEKLKRLDLMNEV